MNGIIIFIVIIISIVLLGRYAIREGQNNSYNKK